MHTVIMQVHNGTQLKAILDYLQTVGIGRVAFPGHEYRSEPETAAPFDESPTVALMEARRAMRIPSEASRPGNANWSNDRVQEIVDGSDPIPSGLDEESVAAARRIARLLARWNR
jgi:hypothetical protein